MPAYGKNPSPAETTDLVANEPAREVGVEVKTSRAITSRSMREN